MAVDWRLASQADPGASFQQGYQNALVQRQQQEDRQIQMQQRDAQMQQQRQQQQFQLTDRHRQDIRLGAGIARRVEQQRGTMDEAGWQIVRQSAQQAGADLTDVPEHFDPAYYQQLQAAAQTLEANSRDPYTLNAGDRRFDGGNNVIAEGGPDVTHQPNIQREIDYYRRPVSEGGLGRPDLADQLRDNHAEGSPVLFDVTGDGVPDLVPRSYVRGQTGQGGAQPPTSQTPEQLTAQAEEAIRNGADPVAVRARLQQMLSRQREAPAFRPAPGGPAPGQGNFPQ